MRLRLMCLSFLLLSACASKMHIPALSVMTGVDFREFSAKGFMFTPEPYSGRYESVGIVNMTMYAEGRLVKVKRPGFESESLEWRFSDLGVQDVLREAHRRAVAMGANALVNFRASSITRTDGMVVVPGVELSGFAIRRLDHEPPSGAP